MINIRQLIMLVITLAAAAIAAVCLAYGLGRHQGSAAERRACEAEIHAAELTAERQARETERKAQEAQKGTSLADLKKARYYLDRLITEQEKALGIEHAESIPEHFGQDMSAMAEDTK